MQETKPAWLGLVRSWNPDVPDEVRKE